MANLCPPCQAKPQPPGTYRGSCQANISTDCKAWTEDFAFTLCDPCSEELGRCAWCLGPITGGFVVTVPTTKQFVRVFQNEPGKHIIGMNVGEQVLVQLTVDVFSYYDWRFSAAKSSREVSLFGIRILRDPQDWQHMTLEIYVDLNKVTESAKIVIEEVPRGNRWWSPPATGKTWQCTVEIQR